MKVKLALAGVACAALGAGVGWLAGGIGLPSRPGAGAPDAGRGAGGEPSPRAGGAPSWNAALGARPAFTEVTALASVDFRHESSRSERCRYPEIMGAGVGLFDCDQDGDLDIYFVNGNRLGGEASPDITNRLYRNDGDWRFVDVTRAAGVGDPGFGQGCCAGDYDQDGDLDLYVSNLGPNVLYRNRGDGTFEDVARAAGVADPGWGQSSCFFDYDADGRLDLYVQNYLTYTGDDPEVFTWVGNTKVVDYASPLGFRGQADRLYRNRGDGTFEDVTEAAGILRPDGKGMGLACVDLDGDRFVDIFVANDTAENFLFWGSAGGRFEEDGLAAGVAFNDSGIPEASMGVDIGDYDGDGRLDLIVPCLRNQVFTLYRNQGRLFADSSVEAGLAPATSASTGFNANFIDYDADGDLDLFFTAGGVRRNELAALDASYNERYGLPDILVANDGKGRYEDVSHHAGPYFRERFIGRGSAVGDIDQDGDTDIVVSNLADRAVLLRNDTRGGHWVSFALVDARGRRQPLGTDVRVTAGGRVQRKVQHPGISYVSQSDFRLHFGLGPAETVERLDILWPGGRGESHEGLAADRFWTLEEGKPPSE
jgi:hypothetical protein